MSAALEPLAIELRFTRRNAELVLLGIKRSTTRRSAHGCVGAEFYLEGERYQIKAIIGTTLARVAQESFLLEGETSPAYFLSEWCRCYGVSVSDVDVHQTVFLHVFEPVLPHFPAPRGRAA